ncbi:xylulokinase [Thermus thermophilus]|uniref:xylulokinase n=1 Tax=Thermus thermophilus TaxID=274 RepID=UPI001FCC8E7E|nr:xylulokinase [Thermus thermophilus]BDG29828.1 xylulokinase [Thermus thermophilus]BDG29883.1 xylulokinase [Thermus thermophilus]
MRAAIGLDLGTSGLKALVLDEEGRKHTEARAGYPLHTPRPGWTEQDPQDWARALREVFRALAPKLSGLEVVGLGLSGQMHGAVFLDREGRPLLPAPLWNDQRTEEEVRWMEEVVPRPELIRRTGNPAVTGFQLPKVLWLKRHHPDLFTRVHRVLLPKDYLGFLLAGAQATEYSDASGVGAMDIARRVWDGELLQALGLVSDLFPELGESHRVVGGLRPEWAEVLGVKAGVPVVAGAGDNAAAALGLGISRHRKGVGSVSLGTSGVLFLPLETPTPDPEGRVHLFCHADGAYHLLGVTLSAAGSLEWLRKLFPEASLETLLREAEAAPLGALGLYFLPFLAGERSPYLEPRLRGAFLGLSLAHTRGHLVRAVLEGVALSLGVVHRVMRRLAQAEAYLATGGGSASDLWLALLAGALEAPIFRVVGEEGAARGAAILALVGTGVYLSLEEALRATQLEAVPGPPPVEGVGALLPDYEAWVELLLERYRRLP